MATAYFLSLRDVDVVDVEFVRLGGGVVPMKLLVDSGFTGQSSFVLSHRAEEVVQALVPPSEAAGAAGTATPHVGCLSRSSNLV